ncbi:Hypothetical predicted protein [Mytilus galloprovincialis]|uniref:Zinc finger PHD-type domain-containing protein n=1 Tax=Mytilus galloprovincialis TaxID=29158 RepID=A0A8B6H5W3_MYTGA|nr:Hypothetical predicted protein [Mytilus galloprovincialis]
MYMSPRNILMSIENPPKTIVNPNEPRNRKDSINHNICPVSDFAVTDSESIECNACDMWLHKYCTILSDELFEKHTTNIDMLYTCHLCTLLDQDDCVTAIQEEYHRSLVYFDLEYFIKSTHLVNVLKRCDILVVQEHWLYSCAKHKLQEVNDTHVCEAKSVDDDLDKEILVRNRRFGGTAVLWRKDIDRVVKFTSDGIDRIVVLTFNISNNPLCLIGIYIPSHNKHRDELYIDIFSQIEEITETSNRARCDKEKYQEAIGESVTNIDTVNLDNASSEISKLVDLLHSAGKKSIPNYRETMTVKTVGRGIWNKEISNASKLLKVGFFEWTNDRLDDSKYKGMNKARKVLRSAQRRAHASKRNKLTEKIMQATQNDSKLFHKKGQRKCNNILTDTMDFKGIEESDPELMMSGWKDYHENLYKIDNLNSHQNFCTEKRRHAEELLTYIVQIVKGKDLPQEIKERVVSPVHKSGKDKLHPENYRGITVTNTFSTLIEGILKDRLEPKLLKIQSKLQRGFTEKTSSLNTAFIVSAAACF